ncbi:class I SAM-dependent methyltransferase [Phenylobacterium sp. J367]|uniref:class I SAM-dependent methyltransferase n=1 Tax=Phenylobacterium sp. J367 TaxID=2898435 RepID=UPI002151E705|nr:class I SAM-dependent methyltransferase [Phenylobacterium sp. J367]MCR5878837.1 class I SAM-dependent methyltransferase [Phenylobacterium sp. J367]
MTAQTLNAQISVSRAGSIPDRIAGWQRRRMFERFLHEMDPGPEDTLLDVGATSDQTLEHSNYAVAWYPHKSKITTVGIDDASFLETRYPGVTFRKADGRALPFADGSFDFVHSSAVLEHVGARADQARFIAELWRVARKGVFLTTPNRWFPIEFHSVLPLVHWLPRPAFWRVLNATGRGELADEAVLNLLGGEDLRKVAQASGAAGKVASVSLLGWPSNLLLIARKAA